ncbi:hypothetical protein D9615_007250 [Tricholomella constricta]|uniref:ER transporter 6TM N-terminal domain-containing protein n=1 Tax=Tricholomella constricta TaxID=117010 RepID=A0A8H5H543_9AGAR|nr:hypothetical protein D9615_007250 [Tricholomella constricta]
MRTDRRKDMEHLRKTLGLRWTYMEAADTSNPIVNKILHSVRLIRDTHSPKDINPWSPGFLTSPPPARGPPPSSPPIPCATRNNTITLYTASLPEFKILTLARIACWYSHVSVIQKIANDRTLRPDDTVLVLEDDVDMERDIHQRLRHVWSFLPAGWDIVYLGHCWSNEGASAPLTPPENATAINGTLPGTHLHPSQRPLCTHASIDRAISWLIQSGRLRSFSVVPSVVVQRKAGKSDVMPGTGSQWKSSLVDEMAVSEEKTQAQRSPMAESMHLPSHLKAPGFFSWILPALKSRRTLKTWIRCCIALAATLVLMVANKTLTNMGQAAFFAAIVAVMLPPSIALSLFILGIVTLLLGMLIGWAWGNAAMAAGLAVRNQARLAQQQQQAQASLVEGIPRAIQYQKFIFQGMFLDPGTSAVYGAFFFVGTFALGTLRAFIPKLALLSVFGSIVLDIVCSYGPLFPTAQYTLAKIFIIPTCYYVAIAIATLVLIFPESLNRVWLTSLQNEFIDPTEQILSYLSRAVESVPSDTKNWAEITDLGYAARQKVVTGTQDLLGQISTTDLEISVGRLGPADLRRISRELKSLMFRVAGLHAFLIFVNKSNAEQTALTTAATSNSGNSTAKAASASVPPSGGAWDRYTVLQHQIRARESKYGHDFDSLMPLLASSSADLRSACDAALLSIKDWIRDCNSWRWAGFFKKHNKIEGDKRQQVLVERLETLQMALERYREVERLGLIKPFEGFFDPVTGLKLKSEGPNEKHTTEMFAARSLYICFVYSYALDAFAERLSKFLAIAVDLDARRPKPRLWAPSGFGKLGRKLMSRREVDRHVVPLAIGTSNDPTSFENRSEESDDEDEEEAEVLEIPKEKSARKNPDALPPTTAFGRFFLLLGNVFRFFKSPEGIFGLRHAIVSLALWIPSVCSSSAWFYYGNRGLWALIMAQTGLAVYAGDQIAGFFVRIAGTILGLLVGMAVWYIGAGSGNGNPYGIVVATTAFTAPFLLGRLAAPPQQMMLWVMTAVTVVFVVGYSWIDTHFPVLVSSGVGVTLGWKRALLVIIGFTAGFIVMMFPRPTSSRTLVRQTLAATTGELGHILAVEVEALLAEEARARAGHYEKVSFVGEKSDQKASPKEQRVRRIAHRVLVVATRLQDLDQSLLTARFEPGLQGLWPHSKYAALYSTQTKLLSSLTLFTGAFTQLNTKWCSVLVHQTPFLNPNLLSDIFSNISILSYALAGAHPLPPSLPRLRDRVVYHERLAPPTLRGPKKLPDAKSSDTDSDTESELEYMADKVDGSSLGFEEISLDILKDGQLPAHATALVALSSIISLVDEMSVIVRDLCGEMTFQGFAEFHRDFLGREEKAIGAGFSSEMGPR